MTACYKAARPIPTLPRKRRGSSKRIAPAPIRGLQFSPRWGRKGAMLSPPSASFLAHYQSLVSSGDIEPDAAQAEAADAFSALEQRLASYKPRRKQRLLCRLFADKAAAPP